MSLTLENGFKTYCFRDKKHLLIESDRIESYIDYYRDNDFDGIWINEMHGYHLDNIDFLYDFSNIAIKRIEITKKISSIEPVYSLSNTLEYLLVDNNKHPINFSLLPNLNCFRGDWLPKHESLFSHKNLKALYLWKYNAKSGDLSKIQELPSLNHLGLIQSNITSLEGIENLGSLQELELTKLRKLISVKSLYGLNSLKKLIIEQCKNVEDLSSLGKIKSIQTLGLNDCGEIDSISFIKNISSLKDFRFVKTKVRDGDISPCLKLENAGFINSKSYSHTSEEILSAIKSRS